MTAALLKTDYKKTLGALGVSGGDQVRPNVAANLKRGIAEFSPAFCSHDGTFVVVGSGPSLPRFLDEIKQEREKGRPVCAVKGAHDYLCENGFEPDIFLTVEPKDKRSQLQHANENTVYMLASRIDPVMFDHLKDRRVVMFHSWSDNEKWPEFKDRFLVGGGTTSGLRAVTAGYVMGFRKFVLYGFDSCLAGDGETKRFTGEKAGYVVDRIVGGRRFLCNGAMALQADEFQEYYGVLRDATFDVKGDGLLAAIVAERKKLGLRV